MVLGCVLGDDTGAGPVGASVSAATGSHRYETAFQLLHKLRVGMVRPDRDRIGGERLVEVNETLVGGGTRGEGRGVPHKEYGVGAVEFRAKLDKPRRRACTLAPPVAGPGRFGPRRRWRRSSRRTRNRTVMSSPMDGRAKTTWKHSDATTSPSCLVATIKKRSRRHP